MRTSNYNIVLPLEKTEDYLIIQGARGSFDIVDKSIVNFNQESILYYSLTGVSCIFVAISTCLLGRNIFRINKSLK